MKFVREGRGTKCFRLDVRVGRVEHFNANPASPSIAIVKSDPTSNALSSAGHAVSTPTAMLIAMLFLLAVGFVLLLVAVLATRRQLWLGRQALAPVGSVTPAAGCGRGEPAPIVSLPSLAGDTLTIGGISRDPRPLLLLFIDAHSALCDPVVREAVDLCRDADVRLLLLGDGRSEDYADLLLRHRVAPGDFLLNSALGEDYQIGPLPSAALVSARGELISRGTVQRREQLDLLLCSVSAEACDTGSCGS